MNRKLLPLIAIVIIAIVGSIVCWFVMKNKTFYNNSNSNSMATEAKTGPAAKYYNIDKDELFDQQVMLQAVNEKDIKYCNQLHKYNRDNCIFDVSSSANKIAFCQEIQDEKLKKTCMELGASRTASAVMDASGCLAIKSAGFQKQCLANIFMNYDSASKCQGFSDEINSMCLDYVHRVDAYNRKDVSLCDNIKDEALKNDCRIISLN